MRARATQFVAKHYQWTVLGLGGLLLLLPLLVYSLRHAAPQASRQDATRLEVTQMWIGPVPASCTYRAAPDLPRSLRLEGCTAALTLADKGRLPSLELLQLPQATRNVPEHPHSFYSGLRPRGPTANAIDADESLLIGFQLPKPLFADTPQGTANKLVFKDFPGVSICYSGRCREALADYAALPLTTSFLSSQAQVDVWIIADRAAFLKVLGPEAVITAMSMQADAEPQLSGAHRSGLLISRQAQFLFIFAALGFLLAASFAEMRGFTAFGFICITQIFLQDALATAYGNDVNLHATAASNAAVVAWAYALSVSLALFVWAAADIRVPLRRGFAALVLTAVAAALLADWVGAGHERVLHVLLADAVLCVLAPAVLVWGHFSWEYRKESRLAAQRAWRDSPSDRRLTYVVLLGLSLVVANLPALFALLPGYRPPAVADARQLTAVALGPLFLVMALDAWFRRRLRQTARSSAALEKAKREAIHSMIQMVAHDTRKPFSLMRTGVALLRRLRSVDEIEGTVSNVVAEVERSIRSVNSMLEDIMTVSTDSKLEVDSVFVDAIVSICIHRVFFIQPHADVALSYRFDHSSALRIDSIKILRVLTTIVENALRATAGKCRMWFHTKEYSEGGRSWVVLTIGNSDSYIPAAKRDHMFDAYFVEGHASSAGLSLAVARTFVELHEGSIVCRSQEKLGTEFIIKLPTADYVVRREAGLATPFLPPHSRDITSSLEAQKTVSTPVLEDELTLRELSAHAQIRGIVQVLGRPLRILLIDDEPIYTAALEGLLDQVAEPVDSALGAILEAVSVTNPTDAMKALATGAVDLAIVDVDLGSLSFDGLTLAKRYKAQGLMHFVCVHSNRSFPADYKRAIDGGADSFLPKPMSRSHLFEVVLSAATIAKAFQAKEYSQDQPGQWRRPHMIVVVDDDIFVREAWALTLSPKPCLTFADCQSVLEWIKSNPAEVKKVGCFVLDLYFDGQPDGFKLAEDVRALCPVPILLSSDASVDLRQHRAIDAVIPKEPMELESLLLHVDKALNRDKQA